MFLDFLCENQEDIQKIQCTYMHTFHIVQSTDCMVLLTNKSKTKPSRAAVFLKADLTVQCTSPVTNRQGLDLATVRYGPDSKEVSIHLLINKPYTQKLIKKSETRWGQYLCHFTRTLPREMPYREERRAFSGVHSVWPPEMRPMHAPHAWPPFWIFSFSRWRYGGGNWRILWPTCWARGIWIISFSSHTAVMWCV